MPIHIAIPSQYAADTGGNTLVEVEGGTVGAALEHLVGQYPGLSDRLFVDGQLKRFVNLYVDDDDIRLLDGLDTELDDGAELSILPAIAGGRPEPGPDAGVAS